MNGAIKEYIECNIKCPRYDLPRWAASLPIATGEEINLDFGNTYQGIYVHSLVAAVPGGLTSQVLNSQNEILININTNTNDISFDYVILNRRLIFRTNTLLAAFSVGFQLITEGTPGGSA